MIQPSARLRLATLKKKIPTLVSSIDKPTAAEASAYMNETGDTPDPQSADWQKWYKKKYPQGKSKSQTIQDNQTKNGG